MCSKAQTVHWPLAWAASFQEKLKEKVREKERKLSVLGAAEVLF